MKKLILPLCILTSHSVIADDDTYLLHEYKIREWKPPVEKEIVLPDRVVKNTQIFSQGGRRVCIEECEKPAVEPSLPEPVVALKSPSLEDIQVEEDYLETRLLHISASVHFEGDKPFTLLRLQCDGEKIEAWSSMNFSEMAGAIHFRAGGGEYHTLTGHGVERIESASEAGCPVKRKRFYQNDAEFVVIGEKDSNSPAFHALKGIHSIYNKERDLLAANYKQMLINAEKKREWEKANPPTPKDITIRFWKRDTE